jgi:fermentation-respiration switch protein FrsA (DUF1100 family)
VFRFKPHEKDGGVLLSLLFRLIKILVLSLAVGTVLLLIFVKQKGNDAIFLPLSSSQGNWEVSKYKGFDDCHFPSENGIMLHGWFFPAPKSGNNPVILWCRSSVGNITLHFDQIKFFQHFGFAVFIFDYRGYGKSQGSPSEEGWYVDALAAYDYLVRQKNIAGRQIVIFGQSFGGAVAIRLAGQNVEAKALVIEATPLSLHTLVKDKTGIDWPVQNLPAWFPSDSALTQVKLPTLIIHGKNDSSVPFAHAEKLLAKSKASRKELFAVNNGGHQDCYLKLGFAYFKKIYEFVQQNP